MKKILTAICSVAVLSAAVMSGCGDNSNNNTAPTEPSTLFEATYPGTDGKIDKSLLNSDNTYELYSPLDKSQAYPIEVFQCEEDGTIISGDIYTYDASYNVSQQDHYEGDVLDYTETREYDDKGNNTRIVSYAGAIDKNNLVSTLVMEYNDNGCEISSKTYDSDNVLCASDTTEYVKIDGLYMVKNQKSYDQNGKLDETHEYSYRSDGTTSKDIRTCYDTKGKVKYYYQTSYDSEGNAITFDYFDKNGKKIDTPQEEIDKYGE